MKKIATLILSDFLLNYTDLIYVPPKTTISRFSETLRKSMCHCCSGFCVVLSPIWNWTFTCQDSFCISHLFTISLCKWLIVNSAACYHHCWLVSKLVNTQICNDVPCTFITMPITKQPWGDMAVTIKDWPCTGSVVQVNRLNRLFLHKVVKVVFNPLRYTKITSC